MFFCCCVRLHRHQLHLVSYGFVSMSLIVAGFVFTVFAVFHRDTQIEPPTTANNTTEAENGEQHNRPWDWIGRSRLGKIWLAGPVLMVVGGVLCGKVMIDWGPAMSRGRTGSLDSQLVDELAFSNLLPIDGGVKARRAASLITGGCSGIAPIALPPPARVSCTSAASAASSTATAADHFLIYPADHPNLSYSLVPQPFPPPLCTFYGSSFSSASSSVNSKKNAACHFDRIIYGPFDQQLEEDEEEEIADDANDKMRMINSKNNKLDKSTQSDRRWWGGDEGAGDCTGQKTETHHFYANGGGCERCAPFWPLLEGKSNCKNSISRSDQHEDQQRPKVIGKFVFAELKKSHSPQNYGTILATSAETDDDGGGDENGDDQQSDIARDQQQQLDNNVQLLLMERTNSATESVLQHNHNNSTNNSRRASKVSCSQGETLIINERSFLI